MYIPNDIKLLSEIEQNNDVVSLFQYKNTSAWISIKDMLTTAMYDKSIRLETGNKKEILSWEGAKVVFISFKTYLIYIISKEKKSIFLGASTGLFRLDAKVLDSYFPYYEQEESKTIYMLNCGSLRDLNKYKTYLKQNKIIVENYLLVVLKKVFAKLVYLPKDKIQNIEAFRNTIDKEGIEVSQKELLSKYKEFIAGYKLYRMFFRFLNIEEAYIVSAPTKSDMVAALKSLDIQTIDIQHGIVGELHRGYNFKIPKDDILPTVDRIDVYNTFWKNEIIKAGYFKEEQINVVGRLKYDIVRANIEELDFKYIIFTGQGAFFEEISKFFQNSDASLAKEDTRLIYKSHPRELISEIDDFKEQIKDLKFCEVYSGNNTTEELIKHCYAHISIFSSCHFDAVYFNHKTYILDIMENNIMLSYASSSPNDFIKINNIKEVLY